MTNVITPIDQFLADQQLGTAVARFSRWHEGNEALPPDGLGGYRALIPLERPGPGEQYAFEVDLDSCTGCKACVTACNHLNGLEDGESWRSVGLLVGGDDDEPFQQTVTTGCHHCAEPACLSGCPVNAYEKDAATGIVAHLDDQCIGCGYCTLMCPYDVPRYSDRLGIVRKCDMCNDRLAVGEAPACVQACPNTAIRITVIAPADAGPKSPGSLVPGAADSSITRPTTVYRSTRPGLSASHAVDDALSEPAEGHPTLVVMLVLTQLSVGAFAAELLVRRFAPLGAAATSFTAGALAAAVLALGASLLHLGRPCYAFRAVAGLRHSWLSREVVAFAVFVCAATLYAVASRVAPGARPLHTVLGSLVVAVGTTGVACSVMLYAVTRRAWWRTTATAARFALSATVTGFASVLAATLAAAAAADAVVAPRAVVPLALVVLAATLAKLAVEAEVLRNLRPGSPTDLARTAGLLTGALRHVLRCRLVAGVTGGILVPGAVVLVAVTTPRPAVAAVAATGGAVLVVLGELCERSMFFRAVSAPRMPGGLP